MEKERRVWKRMVNRNYKVRDRDKVPAKNHRGWTVWTATCAFTTENTPIPEPTLAGRKIHGENERHIKYHAE